jgi:hypothetical protein
VRTGALPAIDMRQSTLHGDPFPQLGSPLRRELSLAELVEAALIRVDVDRPAMGAGSAVLPHPP